MSKNESSKKATDNKVEEKGKKVYKNKDGYFVVKGRRIDPATTIIPLIIVLILGILFIAKPDGSTTTVEAGKTVQLSASEANHLKKIYFKWDLGELREVTTSPSDKVIRTSYKFGLSKSQ